MDNGHHNSKKFSRINIETIYLFCKKWLKNKYYGIIHVYNKFLRIFIFWDAKLISLWNTLKLLFIF